MAYRVAVYPGSFNPIHWGHISIARHILHTNLADEVWLLVSPRNPLKEDVDLASNNERFDMVELALEEAGDLYEVVPAGLEWQLPQPNYTIDTMRYLDSVNVNNYQYSLVIGSDNLACFERWKSYKTLLKNYPILVYPREGYRKEDIPLSRRVTWMDDAPLLSCSSTQVRRMVAAGQDVSSLVGASVAHYIEQNGLYHPAYFMERGKRYMKLSQYDLALNDFLRVQKMDPDNTEAQQFIDIIRAIFEFRYLDQYNP